MCFSAEASFAAAGGLGVAGAASFKFATRRERLIAVIPLIFAVQQLLEGLQWLTIRFGSPSLIAGYGFLFIALVVWPAYIPLAVYLMDHAKRKLLIWIVGLGMALSVFFLMMLITKPLLVLVVNYSIRYQLNVPGGMGMTGIYLLVMAGALFLTSDRAVRYFGILALLTAVVSGLLYYATFVSVWCFLAAVLSVTIYVHLRRTHGARKPNP